MRIQLDYYRILGLPIQAAPEQLQQAYCDRTLQLPRREYSELVIAARKELLDKAYAVLSNPKERAYYDASFLGTELNSSESDNPEASSVIQNSDQEASPDRYNPTLEIKEEQFVGALLILHELGEYELVLKLGRPYLSSGSMSVTLDKGRLGEPDLVRSDIVLTVALACMELGREQWQQAQYENAALSLETGQELLLREGLFASVRGEVQADLYKLCPYRILELLALPQESLQERQQGLQLLKGMLEERGGIDGSGNDQSGLSIDDFLRFIQQLRGYLTAAEQQALFEVEARRPSAVATYLAVYALIARGFAEGYPLWIHQAKMMLKRLSKRQDVYLEEAICALLLGQTEEASRALEYSQEQQTIEFIRQNSQGAPDLLPGLCMYAERWLQTEVFPHFRDLTEQKVSLKEYFADEQVQTYLETLPAETESAYEWSVMEPQRVAYASTPSHLRVVGMSNSATNGRSYSRIATEGEPTGNQHHTHTTDYDQFTQQWQADIQPSSVTANRQSTATISSTVERFSAKQTTQDESDLQGMSPANKVTPLPVAERLAQPSPQVEPHTMPSVSESSPKWQRHAIKSKEEILASVTTGASQAGALTRTVSNNEVLARTPSGRTRRSRNRGESGLKNQSPVVLGVGAVVGIGAIGLLAFIAYGSLQKSFKGVSTGGATKVYPMVRLNRPIIEIPVGSRDRDRNLAASPTPVLTSTPESLNEETAKTVVQTWLSTKAEAMGKNHAVDSLKQILAEPALSRWQKIAQTAKQNNADWQYKHTLQVKSVQKTEGKSDRAKVEAIVNEIANLYEDGELDKSSSYNENLRVRYELVRKNNQWLITNMAVLK